MPRAVRSSNDRKSVLDWHVNSAGHVAVGVVARPRFRRCANFGGAYVQWSRTSSLHKAPIDSIGALCPTRMYGCLSGVLIVPQARYSSPVSTFSAALSARTVSAESVVARAIAIMRIARHSP